MIKIWYHCRFKRKIHRILL